MDQISTCYTCITLLACFTRSALKLETPTACVRPLFWASASPSTNLLVAQLLIMGNPGQWSYKTKRSISLFFPSHLTTQNKPWTSSIYWRIQLITALNSSWRLDDIFGWACELQILWKALLPFNRLLQNLERLRVLKFAQLSCLSWFIHSNQISNYDWGLERQWMWRVLPDTVQ